MYIQGQDKVLYEIVSNYLYAMTNVLWGQDDPIFAKTLGVQAVFDVLKEIAKNEEVGSLPSDYFEGQFKKVEGFNFHTDFYGVQSKVRARLKNTLILKFELKGFNELKISQEECELLRGETD